MTDTNFEARLTHIEKLLFESGIYGRGATGRTGATGATGAAG